jgi:hypothetical protein
MICYSDGRFYYLISLCFSTDKVQGTVRMCTNKGVYNLYTTARNPVLLAHRRTTMLTSGVH